MRCSTTVKRQSRQLIWIESREARLAALRVDVDLRAHHGHAFVPKLYAMKKRLPIDETLRCEVRSVSGSLSDTDTVRLGLEALLRQGAWCPP